MYFTRPSLVLLLILLLNLTAWPLQSSAETARKSSKTVPAKSAPAPKAGKSVKAKTAPARKPTPVPTPEPTPATTPQPSPTDDTPPTSGSATVLSPTPVPAPAGTTYPSQNAEALQALRTDIDVLLSSSALASAHVGLIAESLNTGVVLYEHDADKTFLPASNLKLFTTAAALDRLGPDFHYETHLLSTDPNLTDGTIDGYLYVKGSGDPTFAPRFHGGNTLAPFQAWAKQLKERGITRITEGIIGDDSAFDDDGIAPGWAWNYLDTWYAAETSGLSLNDNCYDVLLSPGGQVGNPVQLEVVSPRKANGQWSITATTTNRTSTRNYADSQIRFLPTPGGETTEIAGTMPLNSLPCQKTIPVKNPTRFFLTELSQVLKEAGIQVGENLQPIRSVKDRSKYTATALTELAVYTSPPLKDIITVTNKKSINLYAEQIFKTLGRRGDVPGSFTNGFAVVQQFLSKNGVPTPGFYMADGCGLSSHDMVRPRHMLGLLKVMAKHPAHDAFYASLPVAGQDGTLRGRLGDASALGRVHAKTGYIRQAMCLSGYIENRDGETFAFSIMVSLSPEKPERVIPAIDKIVLRLAQFPQDKTAK